MPSRFAGAGMIKVINAKIKDYHSEFKGVSFAAPAAGTNHIPCTSLVVRSIYSNLLSHSNSIPFSFGFSKKSHTHNSVDTLSVSLYLDWFHTDFGKRIDEAIAKARDLDIPSSTVEFCGESWNVHRFAPSYYKHHLSSGDIHIYMSSHSAFGRVANCKIDIGSVSCWRGGRSLFTDIKLQLMSHGCQVVKEIVGRIDMCTDIVGLDIDKTNLDDRKYWVRKATKFGTIVEHNRLDTVTIGKGNLMLRIYDKVRELKNKKATNKQEIFAKVWGEKKYDSQEVTRVEFQFRREVLAQFEKNKGEKLQTVDQLYNNLESLWAYSCGVWARHNSKPVDRDNKNQSRAQASSFWQKISRVNWGKDCLFHRVVTKTRKNIDALKEQIRGLMVTVVAERGYDSRDYFGIMSECKSMVQHLMDKYMINEPVKFDSKYRMRKSEAILGLQGA